MADGDFEYYAGSLKKGQDDRGGYIEGYLYIPVFDKSVIVRIRNKEGKYYGFWVNRRRQWNRGGNSGGSSSGGGEEQVPF